MTIFPYFTLKYQYSVRTIDLLNKEYIFFSFIKNVLLHLTKESSDNNGNTEFYQKPLKDIHLWTDFYIKLKAINYLE